MGEKEMKAGAENGRKNGEIKKKITLNVAL
jgi:hypothetical protein